MEAGATWRMATTRPQKADYLEIGFKGIAGSRKTEEDKIDGDIVKRENKTSYLSTSKLYFNLS